MLSLIKIELIISQWLFLYTVDVIPMRRRFMKCHVTNIKVYCFLFLHPDVTTTPQAQASTEKLFLPQETPLFSRLLKYGKKLICFLSRFLVMLQYIFTHAWAILMEIILIRLLFFTYIILISNSINCSCNFEKNALLHEYSNKSNELILRSHTFFIVFERFNLCSFALFFQIALETNDKPCCPYLCRSQFYRFLSPRSIPVHLHLFIFCPGTIQSLVLAKAEYLWLGICSDSFPVAHVGWWELWLGIRVRVRVCIYVYGGISS